LRHTKADPIGRPNSSLARREPGADDNLVAAIDTMLGAAAAPDQTDRLVAAWRETESRGARPGGIGTEGGVAERISADEVRLLDNWNQFRDTTIAAAEFGALLDTFARTVREAPQWSFARVNDRWEARRSPAAPPSLRAAAEALAAPWITRHDVESFLVAWRATEVGHHPPEHPARRGPAAPPRRRPPRTRRPGGSIQGGVAVGRGIRSPARRLRRRPDG
jgi:hypothetical protein